MPPLMELGNLLIPLATNQVNMICQQDPNSVSKEPKNLAFEMFTLNPTTKIPLERN